MRKNKLSELEDSLRVLFSNNYGPYSAEELAKKFNSRKHFILQILAKLNREGIVSQEQHSICHDGGIGRTFFDREPKYIPPSRGGRCWHPDTFHSLVVDPPKEIAPYVY